ncbi:uncharacterized protein YjiS (DUF1127 family) [Agrobacterium vitis]|nr:uncharacterized protein YjiS (DUF1127 family) [Agrobacterium vitis]MBE1438467.1 uncharacterized protein YjiS (DUF1127 family) [Agrobacterium vitis]
MVTIDTIECAARENVTPTAPQASKINLVSGLRRLLSALSRWWMVRSTRASLEDIGDDLLKDVGITRQQARTELKRSTYLF